MLQETQVGNASTDVISLSAVDLGTTATAVDGVTTIAGATLGVLDTAINAVSTQRGNLGATQNRLESVVRNLSVTAENLSAAESRIRDVDVAEEMMSFSLTDLAAGRHRNAGASQWCVSGRTSTARLSYWSGPALLAPVILFFESATPSQRE